MTTFEIIRLIQAPLSLVYYVGMVLLALGCWKFYLLSRHRGYLTAVIGVIISLCISMFWWSSSFLFFLPLTENLMMRLYGTPILIDSLSILSMISAASVYLALAFEFFRQWKSAPIPEN